MRCTEVLVGWATDRLGVAVWEGLPPDVDGLGLSDSLGDDAIAGATVLAGDAVGEPLLKVMPNMSCVIATMTAIIAAKAPMAPHAG